MAKPTKISGFGKVGIALAGAAGFALAMPSAGLAVGADNAPVSFTPSEFATFTPASVDPQLVRRVADTIRAKGLELSFTPAGAVTARDKTVTVAVRVDDVTARAISVRSAVASVSGESGVRPSVSTITPTRYNLGVARGYQSFAAKKPTLPTGVRSVEMPDLADFKPAGGSAADKPSRFQPRIALEEETTVGRAPRTLEGLGEQSVDVSGAYRVTGNLNVTAGVRLSQERDRIAPLTDNAQDSQAVYVGTQLRF